MFTGIIETMGTVTEVTQEGSNRNLKIKSSLSNELKVDQSISHNGVCLTVTAINEDEHSVTAINETLLKSTLGQLKVGDKVNLERCTAVGGRLDGHIVQGHVDQKASCISKKDEDGSWLFSFRYDASIGNITVEKGSICINGVSLTVFNSGLNEFTVAIIPYTLEHTNFKDIVVGTEVNLEFDIIGKYVSKLLSLRA
ncbi:riboflavin synthase [Albibacterium bauzanense]|uniref:Riboflavin synthase n=1 Tax=Albibacterium bauzanense TaxID=653929 RepID=A0A4R1LU85_9SPHI|nr:riboflavin synthase [Albibacterium bauzanense]TCK80713.1 riboflavin synthase alpha chain [Albibacterium bauzanense]